ncbi:MAG: glycosyltransferase [Clostridia bacterium]|nr:glycosyltransferase [Clostridia bacterium]
MKKKPTVYVVILCVWAVCVGALFTACGMIVYDFLNGRNVTAGMVAACVLLVLNALMLAYMWLGSVKDFMFSFLFLCNKKRILKRYDTIINSKPDVTKLSSDGKSPRVLLLYCTCNDFNADALEACMRQNYDNFETVILDDSSKKEYLEAVDRFADKTGANVVRRENREGFKAGNLNNYLQGRTDYDYFVVLDSDERIPENYIAETLKYFAYSAKVGVVQAAHKATKGTNLFQNLMGLSVKSNGRICQVMKNFYGSNALIGHGMAISRACYEKTGGFPKVVAEDISFAIDVKNSGYRVLYAPNILCEEEFPVDYLCLKKRQAKWVQGNVEFMRKYNRSITTSKMTWYEKLDVRLSHYNLPIIPMLSFLIIINTILIGALGFDVGGYSKALILLMVVFLVSPLIPDFFVHGKRGNVLRLFGYAALNFVVYASLVPMMIVTVTCALFGKKARFIVTPKEERHISVREALKGSYDSIVFAAVIGVLTYFTYFSLMPTLLLVGCCALTPIAVLTANVAVRVSRLKTVRAALY